MTAGQWDDLDTDETAQVHALAQLGGLPYRATRLADVQAEHVRWLWPRWIPLGMTTVIDGPPGAGKSTLMLDLAARITTGRPMPGERDATLRASAVVVMTAEDPLAPVVRPRLDAAGADPSMVYALDAVRRVDADGRERWRPPAIPDDLDALERLVADTGAVLVVVDVLTAFLSGRHDSYRDQDVRAALAPLAEMAERTGTAVVMLRHPRKSGGTAQQAGGGSIAIGGAARSWLAAAPDPSDETGVHRVLASVRPSLTAAPASMGYSLAAADPMSAAHVEWSGPVDVSADQLYVAPPSDAERSERDDAADWLRSLLADGPMPAAEVKSAAGREGLSWRTVQRASQRADIDVHREGHGRSHMSVWALTPTPAGASGHAKTWRESDGGPDQDIHTPEPGSDAHSRHVSTRGVSSQTEPENAASTGALVGHRTHLGATTRDGTDDRCSSPGCGSRRQPGTAWCRAHGPGGHLHSDTRERSA